MGYQVISVEDLPKTPDRPCVRRAIGDAVGLESAAVNLYEAEPGEQVPLAYHYHDEQEELFYVLDGTLAIQTPERTYEIDADELFVAEPGSPHRAHNPPDGKGAVRVLAIGAPRVQDTHRYQPGK